MRLANINSARFKPTMASPLGLFLSVFIMYYAASFMCSYIPEDDKVQRSIPWGILVVSNGFPVLVWHLKGKFEESQKLDGLTDYEKNRLRPRLQKRIRMCMIYIFYNFFISLFAAFVFYICSDNCLIFKRILPVYSGALGATIFGFGVIVSEYNRIKDFLIEVSDRQAKEKYAKERLEKMKEKEQLEKMK